MFTHENEIDDLMSRAKAGDEAAIGELFAMFRPRLKRMVQLRLDRRLQGRIDASDVVQEAFIDATKKSTDYFSAPKAPVFLWLRYLVAMRLKALHRHHLGVKKRDAKLDVSVFHCGVPEADSAALAAQLMGKFTSPSHAAVRAERILKMQDAICSLDPIDREILALRHFEDLSRSESAQELGIEESAAGKRYIRALKRLRHLLDEDA